MSKGTPVRTMRVPEEIVQRVNAAIDSANARRFQEPYDWTGWILQAAKEKLRHLERAKCSRQKRRKHPQAQAVVSVVDVSGPQPLVAQPATTI